MAFRRFVVLLPVALAAACGGKTLEPGTGEPPAPQNPQPEPPRVEPVASCAAAPAWWEPLPAASIVGPPTLAFSPDAQSVALLGRWSATVASMQDGAELTTLQTEALDPSWTQGVTHGESLAELRELSTSNVLATLDLSPPSSATQWLQLAASRFEPSGNVITLSCHGGPDDAVELAITRWGTAMHGIDRVFLPAGSCWSNWADDTLLAPTASGGVVTVEPEGGRLYHADPASGVVTSVDALDGAPKDPVGVSPYSWPILSLDVDAAGTRAAVATTDGKVRIWTLPELELAGTLDAGFIGVNEMTYMPTTESPLAWSPDGKLLAYMRPGGMLVIRDLLRDEVIFTVEPPPQRADQAQWLGDSPMAVKFLPSGEGFVVAFEHGVGLWRCGG